MNSRRAGRWSLHKHRWEAELSADVGAAQALYIMALYDFASQPGFVSRLVSCFEAEQTDAQLIANVNAAFGTEIPVQEFTDVTVFRSDSH